MALKNLMAWLQCRASDTPDTLEKNMGYQRKANAHAGCTPDTSDTPCFADTCATTQIEPFGEAVNDQALAVMPAPEPPPDPNAWRELATAYHAHHFGCPLCVAAGRGTGYGLRCGTGAALWATYDKASERRTS